MSSSVMKLGLRCLFLLFCFVLVGCSTIIKNRTPARMFQNSSDIYPIEMKVSCVNPRVNVKNLSSRIVIDGKSQQMKKIGDGNFAFNYKRPDKSHKANYYYEVDYQEGNSSSAIVKTKKSDLYQLFIVNRYVIGFESNRGTPGATVNLLGRGFEKGDTVDLNGVACQTEFISPNVLSFRVPLLDNHGFMRAKLLSENGNIGLGDFKVDLAYIHSNLDAIDLNSKEKKIFRISIDFEAPEDGIFIDVTTNIPESIIMKDIHIPAGKTSATAVVQGRETGSGILYFSSPGFEDLKLPVNVRSIDGKNNTSHAKDDNDDVDEEFLTIQ